MNLITFGSPRTNNVVVDNDENIEGYQGVDELTGIGQPTVATLDLLKNLTAVGPGEEGNPPDREMNAESDCLAQASTLTCLHPTP